MKIKRLLVVIKGQCRFPVDMLRYDRLVPYTGTDASFVTSSVQGSTTGEVTVTLMGWLHGNDGGPSSLPTVDRWKSFGWSVEQVEIDGIQQHIVKVHP